MAGLPAVVRPTVTGSVRPTVKKLDEALPARRRCPSDRLWCAPDRGEADRHGQSQRRSQRAEPHAYGIDHSGARG